jgi:hypothetical protein
MIEERSDGNSLAGIKAVLIADKANKDKEVAMLVEKDSGARKPRVSIEIGTRGPIN